MSPIHSSFKAKIFFCKSQPPTKLYRYIACSSSIGSSRKAKTAELFVPICIELVGARREEGREKIAKSCQKIPLKN